MWPPPACAVLLPAKGALGVPIQHHSSVPPTHCPQVAPLFAIHGLPKTPGDGESFLGGPGNEMTRSELQASWSSHNLHLLVSFAPHGNLDT